MGGSSVGWVFGLVSGAWVLLCLSLVKISFPGLTGFLWVGII